MTPLAYLWVRYQLQDITADELGSSAVDLLATYDQDELAVVAGLSSYSSGAEVVAAMDDLGEAFNFPSAIDPKQRNDLALLIIQCARAHLISNEQAAALAWRLSGIRAGGVFSIDEWLQNIESDYELLRTYPENRDEILALLAMHIESAPSNNEAP